MSPRQCGCPLDSVGVPKTVWVSPRQCGCPQESVGVHKTVWVSPRQYGCPRPLPGSIDVSPEGSSSSCATVHKLTNIYIYYGYIMLSHYKVLSKSAFYRISSPNLSFLTCHLQSSQIVTGPSSVKWDTQSTILRAKFLHQTCEWF